MEFGIKKLDEVSDIIREQAAESLSEEYHSSTLDKFITINQIENFLAKLAATPGVDLVQKRTALEKILKLLQQNIKGKTK